MQTSYDVVIVGGGHNGLIAASYLGMAGKKVLVLERGDEFGGATKSQRVFPDFEAWLSRYAYLVSLLPRQIVEDLQLDFHCLPRRIGSCTAFETDAGQQAAFIVSNESEQATRDSLFRLTQDESQWQGYCAFQQHAEAIAKLFWPSLLEPLVTKETLYRRANSTVARQAWQWFVERPLGESIEHFVQHDALRGLLMTDGKIGVSTHAYDPTLLQNRCFLYHVVGGGDGRWLVPVGGMRSLVNALIARAQSSGVELQAGSEVQALESHGDTYSVHFQQADRLSACRCKYVLIAGGPSLIARLTNSQPQRAESDEGSVTKVNMLLRRLPRLKAAGISSVDAFTGSFHVDEGYEQMEAAYIQSRQGALPAKPPLEMYCHTLTDPSILGPSLREEGFQTLTLFGLDVPYRLFKEHHNAQVETVKRAYLTALDRVCAEPFEDCLARNADGTPCLEIKSPLDLERELVLDQGNIFHNAPTWFFATSQQQVGKRGVETDLERVFVAGSAAYRGGAVSGIPGYHAAHAVLDDLGSS